MTRFLFIFWVLGCLLGLAGPRSWAEEAAFGPAYQKFRLTLEPGHRTEALGPLYYSEHRDTVDVWAIPPLLSHTRDRVTDYEEFDFAYPILTYDRFGREYRFQIFQLFAFSGGKTFSETNVDRFTLFPIVFVERSKVPEKNYTAVVPFYGTIKNRLFRDEVDFVMMPIYVKSRKRDVVTENYVWPFYHQRYGNGLKGWQIWPFYGEEHKDITYATNNWGDTITNAGHDKVFVMWPFYNKAQLGIGTTNPSTEFLAAPFYSKVRSPMRDSTTYFWPFGYTHTIDREKKYEEWDAPWPLVEFARGEGRTANRVFPFYSKVKTKGQEVDWYLWPAWRSNKIYAPPLERRRNRVLFFLYSDTFERNTETGQVGRRIDLWPFFTAQRDRNGNVRLQVLSILEPILPASKSIERDYSQVWSLWRSQKNAKTGASSQSLLWNLYRREKTPETKRVSALFGLFKYQSNPSGKSWRIFYIPVGHASPQAKEPGVVR